MRAAPLLAALLVACTPESADPVDEVRDYSHPMDDVLRMTDATVLGTHNSTHLEPTPALVEEWEYSHLPLDEQAADQGVRQFELDIHWDQSEGRFLAYHVDIVDDLTTCEALVDCFRALRSFSDGARGHFPMVVGIEPKPEEGGDPLNDDAWKTLDAELAQAWPDHLLVPADVQGDAPTMREAIAGVGWPTLSVARGTLTVVLWAGGQERADYLAANGPSHLLFAEMQDPGDPLASAFRVDHADEDPELISDLVAQGFWVRSRGDAAGVEPRAGDTTKRDFAIAIGAHAVSTDFPDPVDGVDYDGSIPTGTPVACNVVTSPVECLSEMLEDPELLDGVVVD